jgi:hypothetical protein
MLENDTRLAAELLVKVDETKNELTKKQGVLDDLLEKNRLAKEGQVKKK